MGTALLVMDLQNGIVDRLADQAETLLTSVSGAIAAARSASIPVVFVRVALRDGAPEASRRNKSFSTLGASNVMSEDGPSTQIHPRVEPRSGEMVVTKRRVSAFSGSDLDVVLRALDVDALVLSGIATSGVVLSTLRQAADLDFMLTVLHDACADADAEVHRVLMEKVFPRQATVLSVDEWVDRIVNATA